MFVGLPNLARIDIQSRQPTSAMAAGVDANDVSQIQNLSRGLRRMPHNSRFSVLMPSWDWVRKMLPKSYEFGLLSQREIRKIIGMDEKVRLGFVKTLEIGQEIQVGLRNIVDASAIALHRLHSSIAQPTGGERAFPEDALKHNFVISQ